MRAALALAVFCLMPLSAGADELTVAAAANLQFTLEEIKAVFEQQTGIQLKTVLGFSGKLTTQIKNGAPFDIFMSADEDYPQRLYTDGVTLGPPKVYAYGSLVLWTFKDLDLSQGIAGLPSAAFEKIAVASPQAAPYGREAVNAMTHHNVYHAIESKLVYGESVSQVNQFITTQAADAGFTAKSIVLAPNMSGKGKWMEVDPKAYRPIAQSAVLLKHAESRKENAQRFYDFLFSARAREIFKKYGYILP